MQPSGEVGRFEVDDQPSPPADRQRSVEIKSMCRARVLLKWFSPQLIAGIVAAFAATTDSLAQSTHEKSKALAVTATPIGDPVLESHLFPPRSLRRHGNAAVLLERIAVYLDDDEAGDKRRAASDFLELPKSDFDSSKAREAVRPPIHGLQRAAYRSYADWEYPLGEVRFQSIILPGVTKIQTELRALALEARCEAAEGEPAAALERVATGLGVVDHVQTIPMALTKYLACEMAAPFFQVIEETIEQPGCPNLYWSLHALPSPLIDTKPLVDWWRRAPYLHAPAALELEKSLSDSQWRELNLQLGGMVSVEFGGFAGTVLKNGEPLQVDVTRARSRLKRTAEKPEAVDEMSDDEVVVRYFMQRYQTLVDRFMSPLLLRPVQAIPYYRRNIASHQIDWKSEEPAVRDSVPHTMDVYYAAWELERKLNALTVIEAIRHHAAINEQGFPDELSDIRELPAISDPFTGAPFEYRVENNVAFLSAKQITVGKWTSAPIRYAIRQVPARPDVTEQ